MGVWVKRGWKTKSALVPNRETPPVKLKYFKTLELFSHKLRCPPHQIYMCNDQNCLAAGIHFKFLYNRATVEE